jgi:hypothetical protein
VVGFDREGPCASVTIYPRRYLLIAIVLVMPISPEQFVTLLPAAAQWAEDQEVMILRTGVALSDIQQADARRVGVSLPGKIRLLKVSAIPAPLDPALAWAAADISLITPQTVGMALRYGIFLRSDYWNNRLTFLHECVHTAQYERMGGFLPFLRQYLNECVTIGYPEAPMEQEAIRKAASVVG